MWIIKYMIPETKFFMEEHEKASILKDDDGNEIIFTNQDEVYKKAHELQCIENERPLEEPRNVFFPFKKE